MEDFGFEHICIDCGKELHSDDDIGALQLGVPEGLRCKECVDKDFE